MIYELVDARDPIRQGDIFRNVPRVDFALSSLAVIDEKDELRATTWRDAVLSSSASHPISAVLAVKPVTAIVITQNCDAVRGQSLSLCQVDDFLSATGQSAPKDAKGWQKVVMRLARTNHRFFYLPEDAAFHINTRMAADFRVVLPVPRDDLESMKDHRVGRLNRMAREHFRESLSHFFRRYAYNEWYPLSRDEFSHYAAQAGESVPPYEWQK